MNDLFKHPLSRLNGVASTFTYDPAARLLSLTHAKGPSSIDVETYAYDAVGNRISHSTSLGQPLVTQPIASAVYDANNEQKQVGPMVNGFDSNGNLISSSNSSGTTSYAWDARNRLASVSGPNGQITRFTSDFAGNLIQQTDAGPSLNLTRTFVLDGLTNVTFVSQTDGDQYSVLTGQSIDIHLAAVHGNGQVEYGVTDAINSTIATVDQGGVLKGRFYYEPFGQTTAANSAYPFQYTGRVSVSSGLYYYRARFYNSQTGRFISEDPLGFGGGPNQYQYGWGNPISTTDPLGLFGLADLPTLPQGFVDFSAGFGDAILATLSFGVVNGQSLRSGLGISGVNQCTAQYLGGRISGTAATLAAYAGGAIPATLTHFTTAAGAAGIAESGEILGGLGAFGEGTYATAGSRLFVPPSSIVPITVSGNGFIRVIPGAVFLRGGSPLTTAWFNLYGLFANRSLAQGNCGCQ
jgi:RHS repeat-associated protein